MTMTAFAACFTHTRMQTQRDSTMLTTPADTAIRHETGIVDRTAGLEPAPDGLGHRTSDPVELRARKFMRLAPRLEFAGVCRATPTNSHPGANPRSERP